MILLIKASLVVAVMLLFYKCFLEKESFFATNRIYLLSCLFFACTLPFIAMPEFVQHQGMVSKILERQEISSDAAPAALFLPEVPEEATMETDPFNNNLSISDQETASEEQSMRPPLNTAQRTIWKPIDWLTLIYLFGVLILALKLLAQIGRTFWVIYANDDQIADERDVIVNLNGKVDPCSFFKYIFINPSQYDYETYEQIIAHEKIHINKMHTVDLLLTELAVIILWFNPFVWLLRKEVEKNIEYQTDDLFVRSKREEKENYQMNLLKIATYTQPLSITTNYNQSLIKQRIMKMNTRKSNYYSYWKYAFTAPLLFTLLLLLNKPVISSASIVSSPPKDFAGVEAISRETGEELLSQSRSEAPKEELLQQIPESFEGPDEAAVTVKEGCGKLTRAIRAENIEEVKKLLQSIDPNCSDPDPGYEVIEHSAKGYTVHRYHARTPLVAAARVGNLEIAKLLLDAGAKVDDFGHQDPSPMMEAARSRHLEFTQFLLNNEADVNLESDTHGSALIMAAVGGRTEIVKLLLAKGADIKLVNSGQGSALNAAAWHGNTDVVELLIAEGAEVNAKTSSHGSALSSAAWNGNERTVELLLDKGADVNMITSGHGSALNSAAWNGHKATVELLLSRGAEVNMVTGGHGSALNSAAWNGHDQTVELLLAEGADINLVTGGHGSALNSAAWNGHHSTVELLLSKGADINLTTGGHGSALNSAAWNGHDQTVDLLLAKGADINLVTGGHGSALNSAAWNGHRSTVELLLAKGADINLTTGGHGSALNSAAWNGHESTVELLLARGADVNLVTGGHGSALNSAAWNGHNGTVALLLTKGADIDLITGGHGSALNSAAWNGHQSTVELLISKGADVNLITGGHGSALNSASWNGHLETVKLLVAKGADVNLRSGGHGTPLASAYRNGQEHIVKYLRSQGAK